MKCIRCRNSITPGTEIVVDELALERAHCPYCLEILTTEPALDDEEIDHQSAERLERRARVREQFVDRLVKASQDGLLHCPLCGHTLNRIDRQLLLKAEYFRCHLCGHDLATVGYQQEAYHEQRWAPVVFALKAQAEKENCVDCCYIGAIAKACQRAYSWMPSAGSKHLDHLARIARRPHRKIPDCDWQSCVAVAQYQKTAGEALLLL